MDPCTYHAHAHAYLPRVMPSEGRMPPGSWLNRKTVKGPLTLGMFTSLGWYTVLVIHYASVRVLAHMILEVSPFCKKEMRYEIIINTHTRACTRLHTPLLLALFLKVLEVDEHRAAKQSHLLHCGRALRKRHAETIHACLPTKNGAVLVTCTCACPEPVLAKRRSLSGN